MRFKIFKQYDAMDCGPSCIRMVANFYGKTILQSEARELCEISKHGVNALGISNAADKIGFDTDCIKVSTNLLNQITLPAILHWSQNHFVVLYKMSADKYFIADPAIGKIKLSKKEFEKKWCFSNEENKAAEGIALIFYPSESFKTNKASRGLNEIVAGIEMNKKKVIWDYVYGYQKEIALILFTLLVSAAIQFVLPYVTKNIVDRGIKNGQINFLVLMLIAQFCLLVGRLLAEYIRGNFLLKVGTKINIRILTDFIVKMMKLPLSFFGAQTKGGILQRMQDHTRIESFITGSLLNIIFATVNFFVLSIVLAYYNIAIFAVFIVISVIYSGWTLLFINPRKKLNYKTFELSSREQNINMQLLEGMQEIKLFSMARKIEKTWTDLQQQLFIVNLRNFRLDQIQRTGGTLINEVKNILVIFLAATLVINGTITLGTMMAIQLIIGQLNSPIEQFMTFFKSWQDADISMSRLNEIHMLKNEDDVLDQFKIPHSQLMHVYGAKKTVFQPFTNVTLQVPQLIAFRNVSYTYPGAGNEPVLKNITIEIPIGKTTAIVGMSGSGKTTFLKLLLRYFEPQSGNIYLNGSFLSGMPHEAWRNKCGVVMQDSYIFSDSIRNNIALGTDQIDLNRLINACKVANIYDFITGLPIGFDTKIGMEGHDISMGQRQRILIARAVYRDPAFILFDEATNSLDSNNEKQIHDNLQHFFLNKTVIVIAHRLSTVKSADQIIMLEKGRITEKGTHQYLIDLKGGYYELVKNQIQ